MPIAHANGIDLDYDTFGDPSDPALVLIMGFSAQKIAWDEEFCEQLAGRGLFAVRFDNRDVGQSSKIEGGPPPNLAKALTGDTSSASYRLDDMAADTAGLLDAICVPAAHVVGASMGGMIAQCLAINHPDRVLSVCSIMSTTGNPQVGQPTPEAMGALLAPPPQTRDEAMQRSVEANKVIGSPAYPAGEAKIRDRAGRAWDRGHDARGVARQLIAILASPDRTERLATLNMPALVIHGEADPLVGVSGGRATAEAIPGAELLVIPGMGHDLPPEVWPQVVDVIFANAARASAPSSR